MIDGVFQKSVVQVLFFLCSWSRSLFAFPEETLDIDQHSMHMAQLVFQYGDIQSTPSRLATSSRLITTWKSISPQKALLEWIVCWLETVQSKQLTAFTNGVSRIYDAWVGIRLHARLFSWTPGVQFSRNVCMPN